LRPGERVVALMFSVQLHAVRAWPA
jgi:hypothetical protein